MGTSKSGGEEKLYFCISLSFISLYLSFYLSLSLYLCFSKWEPALSSWLNMKMKILPVIMIRWYLGLLTSELGSQKKNKNHHNLIPEMMGTWYRRSKVMKWTQTSKNIQNPQRVAEFQSSNSTYMGGHVSKSKYLCKIISFCWNPSPPNHHHHPPQIFHLWLIVIDKF